MEPLLVSIPGSYPLIVKSGFTSATGLAIPAAVSVWTMGPIPL